MDALEGREVKGTVCGAVQSKAVNTVIDSSENDVA